MKWQARRTVNRVMGEREMSASELPERHRRVRWAGKRWLPEARIV